MVKRWRQGGDDAEASAGGLIFKVAICSYED